MGYMSHHAMVVTSPRTEDVSVARLKAIEVGCTVSPVVFSPINGVATFLVAPDGSKEGWETSDKGDASRAALVEWLRTSGEYGHYLDWVEIQYGGDGGSEGITWIVNHGDDDLPSVAWAANSPPSGE